MDYNPVSIYLICMNVLIILSVIIVVVVKIASNPGTFKRKKIENYEMQELMKNDNNLIEFNNLYTTLYQNNIQNFEKIRKNLRIRKIIEYIILTMSFIGYFIFDAEIEIYSDEVTLLIRVNIYDRSYSRRVFVCKKLFYKKEIC